MGVKIWARNLDFKPKVKVGVIDSCPTHLKNTTAQWKDGLLDELLDVENPPETLEFPQ